jgi:hypothetical protein
VRLHDERAKRRERWNAGWRCGWGRYWRCWLW